MVNLRPTIWMAMFTFGLTYGVLGWQLSTYPIFWSLGAFGFAFILTIALMWGGALLEQMLRLGPRSIVILLLLSLSMTMAVAASTVFFALLLLMATQGLARLELQTAGLNRWITLFILLSISSSMLSGGWLLGQYRCRVTAACIPQQHNNRSINTGPAPRSQTPWTQTSQRVPLVSGSLW